MAIAVVTWHFAFWPMYYLGLASAGRKALYLGFVPTATSGAFFASLVGVLAIVGGVQAGLGRAPTAPARGGRPLARPSPRTPRLGHRDRRLPARPGLRGEQRLAARSATTARSTSRTRACGGSTTSGSSCSSARWPRSCSRSPPAAGGSSSSASSCCPRSSSLRRSARAGSRSPRSPSRLAATTVRGGRIRVAWMLVGALLLIAGGTIVKNVRSGLVNSPGDVPGVLFDRKVNPVIDLPQELGQTFLTVGGTIGALARPPGHPAGQQLQFGKTLVMPLVAIIPSGEQLLGVTAPRPGASGRRSTSRAAMPVRATRWGSRPSRSCSSTSASPGSGSAWACSASARAGAGGVRWTGAAPHASTPSGPSAPLRSSASATISTRRCAGRSGRRSRSSWRGGCRIVGCRRCDRGSCGARCRRRGGRAAAGAGQRRRRGLAPHRPRTAAAGGDARGHRENSFDAMRLLAALSVFWFHQIAILGHGSVLIPERARRSPSATSA